MVILISSSSERITDLFLCIIGERERSCASAQSPFNYFLLVLMLYKIGIRHCLPRYCCHPSEVTNARAIVDERDSGDL